eukprot:1272552-Rhodomonas_salina.1
MLSYSCIRHTKALTRSVPTKGFVRSQEKEPAKIGASLQLAELVFDLEQTLVCQELDSKKQTETEAPTSLTDSTMHGAKPLNCTKTRKMCTDRKNTA